MKKYILATHINPDYDGLSSIVGFIQNVNRRKEITLWNNCFKLEDEFVIFIPKGLAQSQKWIINNNICVDHISSKFDGLLLFDTTPESHRIGINNKKFNNYLNKKMVFSIDHHTYDKLPNRIEYSFPSTSCCLIEEGIIEDILYLGIWSDTFRLHYNLSQSLGFLDKLLKNGLTEDKMQFYNKLAEPVRSLEMYFDLKENVEIMHFQKNNALFLWVQITNKLKHKNSFDDIINYFQYYCNVLMVSDKYSGRISFRSNSKKYNVALVARHLGGNGHTFSSGASIDGIATKKLSDIFRSIDKLSRDC